MNRALCVSLFASCLGMACGPAAEPPEPIRAAPLQVHGTAVRRGPIAEILTVWGETAALSLLHLTAPVAGRVTMLTALPGDRVAKHAVAARVLPLESEAALNGFALLESSPRRGAAQRATTARLKRDLRAGDIALVAPFAAMVAERFHNPGEHVAPNDVLLDLFDPDSLFVLAQVPVDIAARVRVGLPVEVTIAGIASPGRVESRLATVTAQARTVPVRIALTTPLPPLLNATARCRITLVQRDAALLIPPSALISSLDAERGEVRIATAGGQASRRPVRLGIRTDSAVEVLDGLAVGDVVLTDGSYSLPDDAAIELLPDDGADPPAAS